MQIEQQVINVINTLIALFLLIKSNKTKLKNLNHFKLLLTLIAI